MSERNILLLKIVIVLGFISLLLASCGTPKCPKYPPVEDLPKEPKCLQMKNTDILVPVDKSVWKGRYVYAPIKNCIRWEE